MKINDLFIINQEHSARHQRALKEIVNYEKVQMDMGKRIVDLEQTNRKLRDNEINLKEQLETSEKTVKGYKKECSLLKEQKAEVVEKGIKDKDDLRANIRELEGFKTENISLKDEIQKV